jgi:hypothetical protein
MLTPARTWPCARVLAELGDDKARYADARARRNGRRCHRGMLPEETRRGALSGGHETSLIKRLEPN